MEKKQCGNYNDIFTNDMPDKNQVLDNYIQNCHTHSVNVQYKKIDHPFKSDNKCYLLTKNNNFDKTKKYYVHTYDTTKLFAKIQAFPNMDDKFKADYIEKIGQIANINEVPNCCNCVAFVVYKTFDIKNIIDIYVQYEAEKLASYLYSLFISTNNITNYLDKFISRIYLDMSVFRTINKLNEIMTSDNNDLDESSRLNVNIYMKHIIQIINYFFESDNIEIYTYLCPDFEENYTKLRSLRFLIMTDENINIKIIREADGYVTCVDCMNITNMINENNIFMTYNLNSNLNSNILSYNDDIKNNDDIYAFPYSSWLSIRMIYDDFFDNNLKLFDIYAGMFGTLLQIKKDKYEQSVQTINIFCDELIKIDQINANQSDKNTKTLSYYLRIGFDEMVLLELFKNILSIPTKTLINPDDQKNRTKTLEKYQSNRKNFETFYKQNQKIIHVKDVRVFFIPDRMHYKISDQYKNDNNHIDFFKNIISYENTVITLKGTMLNKIVNNLDIDDSLKASTLIEITNYIQSTQMMFNYFLNTSVIKIIIIDSLFKKYKIKSSGCVNIMHDESFLNNSTTSLLNYSIYDLCNKVDGNNNIIDIKNTDLYVLYQK